jgi:hypothetical protein
VDGAVCQKAWHLCTQVAQQLTDLIDLQVYRSKDIHSGHVLSILITNESRQEVNTLLVLASTFEVLEKLADD